MARLNWQNRQLGKAAGATDYKPRYNLVTPDGTVVASNVAIDLQNQIISQGTPHTAVNDNEFVQFADIGSGIEVNQTTKQISVKTVYPNKYAMINTTNNSSLQISGSNQDVTQFISGYTSKEYDAWQMGSTVSSKFTITAPSDIKIMQFSLQASIVMNTSTETEIILGFSIYKNGNQESLYNESLKGAVNTTITKGFWVNSGFYSVNSGDQFTFACRLYTYKGATVSSQVMRVGAIGLV